MGLKRDKIPSPQTTATAVFTKIEPFSTVKTIGFLQQTGFIPRDAQRVLAYQ